MRVQVAVLNYSTPTHEWVFFIIVPCITNYLGLS